MVTLSTPPSQGRSPDTGEWPERMLPRGIARRLQLRIAGGDFSASRILRLTHRQVTFELCGPDLGLSDGQPLELLEIHSDHRALYSGSATVEHTVSTEASSVVLATLHAAWIDPDTATSPPTAEQLSDAFQQFLSSWRRQTRLNPEFQLATEEMTHFFEALRSWTEALELPLQTRDGHSKDQQLEVYTAQLSSGVLRLIDRLFERLEAVSDTLPKEDQSRHWDYLRRRLHPLLLCSPFAWRTFAKPMGYPGDFEMVSMIAHQKPAPGSLFARLVDAWFLNQPPAEAHRNRLSLLVDRLRDETLASVHRGHRASIFNLGCGPAVEVDRFLRDYPLASEADFVLADFSQETLDSARQILTETRDRHARRTQLEFRRVSVLQFLRSRQHEKTRPFSFIYCAGLLDYLQEPTCRQLLERLYAQLTPGGLLLVTNVDLSNPIKHGMGFLLDWHLAYRTAAEMVRLVPAAADPDLYSVRADPTGLNLFLEIRKPELKPGPVG